MPFFKAFIKLSSGQIGQKSKMFQTPNHECLMGVYKASVEEHLRTSDYRCLTGSNIHAHIP